MKFTMFLPTQRRMTWEMTESNPGQVMIRTRDTDSGAVVMRGRRVSTAGWADAVGAWFDLAKGTMLGKDLEPRVTH